MRIFQNTQQVLLKIFKTNFRTVCVSGFLLLTQLPVYAQDSLAHAHIAVLAGESMYGRGYINNGLGIAEAYIDSVFRSHNLSEYRKLQGYRQQFRYSVNTFPSNMAVSIGDSVFVPGYDFIVDPHSPGLSGTFPCVFITKEQLFLSKRLPDLDGKVLVVDDRNPINIEEEELRKINGLLFYLTLYKKTGLVAIVELTSSDMIWSVYDFVGKRPYITINSSKVPEQFSEITLDIEHAYIKRFKTANLCGYIPGTVYPDSLIVFTAHYDHLGMMGTQTMFPGANDNASGVAMLFSLIDYYRHNPPGYSIVFIAFSGEEIGLRGSKLFADKPPFPLSSIKFLLNLDMIGTGCESLQIFNGTVHPDTFSLLDSINTAHTLLPEIIALGERCNSDHCPFHEKGVPAFFFNTKGEHTSYHDVHDKAEHLPLTAYNDIYTLITLFVAELERSSHNAK